MTTAWFHCFSGIAGDMALGALLDAGLALEAAGVALSAALPPWARFGWPAGAAAD